MTGSPSDSAKPWSQKALRRLVSDLAGMLERVEQEISGLRTHNQALHEEVERLRLDNSPLDASNQALKDEIARLKNLPPRPPFKPSGMEKATQPRLTGAGRRPRRGAKRNPKTGVEVPIEQRRVMVLKPSNALKSQINGGATEGEE